MSEQQEAAAIPGVTRLRKRPVEVEAIRWTGGNLAEVLEFTGSGYFGAVPPEDRDPDPDMTAEVYDKLHGTWVHVYDGQWVVRGVKGELYPVADDVLAATYEPAAESLVTPADEPWTPEQLAEFQAHFDAAMANPGPLRVLPSDHWKARAEAAEVKLSAIRQMAQSWAELAPPDDWGLTPGDTVAADAGRAILAITGSEEADHG